MAEANQRLQALGQQFQQFQQVQQQASQQSRTTAQASVQAHQQTTQAVQATTQAVQGLTRAQQESTAATNVWRQALSVAAGMGLATSLQALVSSIRTFMVESSQTAARFENLRLSLTAIEGSSARAQYTLSSLFETSQRLGTNFEGTVKAFRGLEAAAQGTTLQGDSIRRVFEQISAGARVLGLSNEQLSNAFRALEQMLSKGRLTAEELNQQLSEAVPIARRGLADAFGITTQQLTRMIEAGIIPATSGVLAFGDAMTRLAAQAGGEQLKTFTTLFAQLTNETTAWMAAIGAGLNNILKPFLTTLTDISKQLRELYNIPIPGVKGGPPPASLREPMAMVPSPYSQQIIAAAQRQQVAGFFDPLASVLGPTSAARLTTVDPGLFSRLIAAESAFNPRAESRAGALGLGQLMPATANRLEPRLFGGFSREELFDPETNLRLSAKYLAEQLNRFKNYTDQIALALAAYNAGPGRVTTLLEEARKAGQPATYAGIAGRLPQETQGYVQGILGPVQASLAARQQEQAVTEQAKQQAAQQGLTTQIRDDLVKNIQLTLQEIPKISKEFDVIVQSGQNIGGILDKGMREQAERATEAFQRVAGTIAQIPGVAAQLTEEERQQLAVASQLVAEFRRRVEETIKSPELEILKRQTDQLEQLTLRRKADLLAREQGREVAERYTREQTAAQALQKIEEDRRNATLTQIQQLEIYRQKVKELTTEVNALGAQLDEVQAKEQLPQFMSTLGRVEQFLALPGASAAEEARLRVEQQGVEARRTLTRLLDDLAQNPALLRLVPTIVERLETALTVLPDAVGKQAALAYDKVEAESRDRLSKLGDQIDQIGERLSDAGLKPIDAAIARVHREYSAMRDQLLALQAELERQRPQATAVGRERIDAELEAVQTRLEQLPVARESAMERARLQPQEEVLQRLRNQLQHLQAQQRERQGIRAEQLAESEAITTPKGKAEAAALAEQIKAQERLNYVTSLFESMAGSVGNAWTQALMSIAQGTATVAEAFKAMTQSILMSLAQLASQEAWKALIRVGVGLLGSALGGAATGGATGALGGSAPLGGGGADVLGTGFSGGGGGGGAVDVFGGGGGFGSILGAQGGAVIRKPQMMLLGENPATTPEVVLNRQQMQNLVASGGPTAGGQALTVINVSSREQAEEQAARERAMGKSVVVNYIAEEMAQGERSQLLKIIRLTSR